MASLTESLRESVGPIEPAFDYGGISARVRQKRGALRTRNVAAVALVVIACIAIGAVVISRSRSTGTPKQIPSVSITVPPARLAHAVPAGTIRVASGTVDAASSADTLWVSGFNAISRINPVTGHLVARVRAPGVEDFSKVAVGGRDVWVTADGGVVYRIDTATNRIIATIHVRGTAESVAVGGGSVWASGDAGRFRIDPRTDHVSGGGVIAHDRLGNVIDTTGSLSYGLGALWVSDGSEPPSITRIDPSTGRATITPIEGGWVTVAYGSLWNLGDGVVTRYDPRTYAVIARVRVTRAQALVVAGGAVWVLAAPASSNPTLSYPIKGTAALWEIDPRTNRAAGRPLRLDATQPMTITATANDVWIPDYTSGTLTRFRIIP